LPDIETLKGKRDRALLALFVSAGLRREELATLLRDQMQQRDGRWCLVDLIGKGGRVRTVAIPDWTQQAVAVWLEAMPIKERSGSGQGQQRGKICGSWHVSLLRSTPWWSNMPRGACKLVGRSS
jgi:site-specific recombinase XerC